MLVSPQSNAGQGGSRGLVVTSPSEGEPESGMRSRADEVPKQLQKLSLRPARSLQIRAVPLGAPGSGDGRQQTAYDITSQVTMHNLPGQLIETGATNRIRSFQCDGGQQTYTPRSNSRGSASCELQHCTVPHEVCAQLSDYILLGQKGGGGLVTCDLGSGKARAQLHSLSWVDGLN
jgi:hypothetical protein